jgi:DNA polymerase-3 subunit delta
MGNASLAFFGGADDYRVDRLARAWFEEHTQGIEDDFSKEILNGNVSNVGELEELLGQMRQATQTLSLFGGKKVVWLKDCNFMSDAGVGRHAGSKERVEEWEEMFLSIEGGDVEVVVSASPIDRRKAFFKFFEKNAGECTVVVADAKGQEQENLRFLYGEAKRLNIRLGESAARMLLAKIPDASRLWVLELEKLASYVGEPDGEITEEMVRDQVSVFGEGDFFEAAEAFFALDLPWTLAALDRHFFHESQPRPLLMSFLSRNRLMIQLRALVEGGLVSPGSRSLTKAMLDSAAAKMHPLLSDTSNKSGFNVFTQNPWYLGKLYETASRLKLRSWLRIQQEILRAFDATLQRPDEPLEIFRELAIRCLATKEKGS